jgi:hypothetical protein
MGAYRDEQQTILVYLPLSPEFSTSHQREAKDAGRGRLLWGVLFAAALVLGAVCAATFSGPYPMPLGHADRLAQVMMKPAVAIALSSSRAAWGMAWESSWEQGG